MSLFRKSRSFGQTQTGLFDIVPSTAVITNTVTAIFRRSASQRIRTDVRGIFATFAKLPKIFRRLHRIADPNEQGLVVFFQIGDFWRARLSTFALDVVALVPLVQKGHVALLQTTAATGDTSS